MEVRLGGDLGGVGVCSYSAAGAKDKQVLTCFASCAVQLAGDARRKSANHTRAVGVFDAIPVTKG
eukprot:3246525-Karenia_brevis.AAC.1